DVPERQRSLRAVFDHSWNLLSTAEQTTLRKLSVFRGGFDARAARAIAGASLPMLPGLDDKSLVRFTPKGRYDLHELLRQYAAEKLAEAGELASVANRHLNYFLSLAEAAEAEIYSSNEIAAHDGLELEHDN